MAGQQKTKRRTAGVASTKILITSASIAATLAGWAAISASSPAEANTPQQAPVAVVATAQPQQVPAAAPPHEDDEDDESGGFVFPTATPSPLVQEAQPTTPPVASEQAPQEAPSWQPPTQQTRPRARTRSSR